MAFTFAKQVTPPLESLPSTPADTRYCDTITVTELFQLIFTYCKQTNIDNGLVIDRKLGDKFALLDTSESIYHIEFLADRPHLCILYKIKDWKESGERRLKEKRRAEFERKDKGHKQECIAKIISVLDDHPICGFLPTEHRRIMAQKIVMEGNVELAKQFGVESLMYKGPIEV